MTTTSSPIVSGGRGLERDLRHEQRRGVLRADEREVAVAVDADDVGGDFDAVLGDDPEIERLDGVGPGVRLGEGRCVDDDLALGPGRDARR
jgi:hypothetical protein